jgi:hypothetical protein
VLTVKMMVALVTSALLFDAHASDVAEDQDAERHIDEPMLRDGVVLELPKFKPITDNVAPDVAAKLEGVREVTTGASKEKEASFVPMSDAILSTDTTAWPDPPGAGTQTTRLSLAHIDDAHALDAIDIDVVRSVGPKLVPRRLMPVLPVL